MSRKKRRPLRRKTRSLYTASSWVETTYLRDGEDRLFPIRARAIFRGKKARGESQILREGVWVRHMLFPWCDLGFRPKPGQYDSLGGSIADAIIEHFETHDPEGLEEVIREGQVVPAPDLVEDLGEEVASDVALLE